MRSGRLLLAALFLACGEPAPRAAIVLDDAGLLSPGERARIEEHHRALRLDHDVDYRVQTTRGADDLDAYAAARFESLGVGSESRSGRGLLLVIDPARDGVRLEVSYELEPVFPDAFVGILADHQLVPFLRVGRVGDGVLAATELLVTRIQEELRRGGLAGGAPGSGSGGAGARTEARLSQGLDESFRNGPDVPAGTTPEETVAAYLAAAGARNANPGLDLYSRDTRAFFARRVVTPAQMDAVARAYRRCHAQPARFDESRSRAVVRYPLGERQCAPWLLVLEDGRWRLDLAAASAAIRFGRENAWHFALDAGGAYAFAFADWRLDRQGFPRAR